MQNSKRWVIPVKIVAFVLIFALLSGFLGTLVYPKTGETTPRIHVYRKMTEAPDLLMLGTSATYNAVVPLLLEERTGLDFYDLSTPGQTMLSSYTLLVDSIRQCKIPDTVLLYTNIRRFCRKGISSDWEYQVSVNLPFGYNKMRMVTRGFHLEDWPEATLKAVRGRENLNWNFMVKNWQEDYTLASSVGKAPEEYKPYIGEGYSFEARGQDPAAIELSTDLLDNFSMDKVNRHWFDKIVALCEKHDIELIMLCIPRLPANIIASGDYDGFHRYMTQLAEETGIQFWDLTYLRENQMVVKPEHFRDQYHGNSSFAFPLTEILSEMLNKHFNNTLDLSKYLYDDYETYLQLHKGINALYAGSKVNNTDKFKNYINIYTVTGPDTSVQYRVSIAPKNSDDYELFMDWTGKDFVELGKDYPKGTYNFKFEARVKGTEEVAQTHYKTFTVK